MAPVIVKYMEKNLDTTNHVIAHFPEPFITCVYRSSITVCHCYSNFSCNLYMQWSSIKQGLHVLLYNNVIYKEIETDIKDQLFTCEKVPVINFKIKNIRKAIPLIGCCEKLAFIVAFRYKLRFLVQLLRNLHEQPKCRVFLIDTDCIMFCHSNDMILQQGNNNNKLSFKDRKTLHDTVPLKHNWQALWHYAMVRFHTINLKSHPTAQFTKNCIIHERTHNIYKRKPKSTNFLRNFCINTPFLT